MKVIGRIVESRENMLLVFLGLFVLAVSAFAPRYILPQNLILILYSTAVLGIVALAETIVVLSGGIDISVGAILAASACTVALTIRSDVPTLIAVLLGFLVGTLMGVINGLLISFVRIPPIIVTLATLNIYRGVLQLALGGKLVPGAPAQLSFIGAKLGPLPVSVIIFFITAILVSIFLAHTRLGRMIYACGGNAAAAEVAGVNIKLVQLFIYAASGFLCGLAGLVFASRAAFADRNSALGIEFIAIAALVMGGTDIFGGAGRIRGTVIGSILIFAIYNAMVIGRVSVTWQNAVIGALILLAVSLDVARRKGAHG